MYEYEENMKIVIKILKFVAKVVYKILKTIIILPFLAFYLGATYDLDTYEKEMEKL